jgi:hypothetical protein
VLAFYLEVRTFRIEILPHFPSSGSEHHIHAADFPWTALFAATGGPSDIYAYFASRRAGSEHHHFNADYLWTDFIAAIGGP